MEFSHYDKVPKEIIEKIVFRIKGIKTLITNKWIINFIQFL